MVHGGAAIAQGHGGWRGACVLRDVFVQLAIFRAAIHAALATGLGRRIVIAFDDQIRFGAAIEADVQVFANALAAQVLGCGILSGRILQLITRAFHGLNAHGLPLNTPLRHVIGLTGLRFACVDDELDCLSHGAEVLNALNGQRQTDRNRSCLVVRGVCSVGATC